LERGADLEAKMENHSMPLHVVAENGKVAAVQSLVDYGANVQVYRKELWTPLHVASWNGNPEVVQLLLKRTANLEAKTDDHSMPLFIAMDCAMTTTRWYGCPTHPQEMMI
jgi:ankyrin repeat protein